MEELKKHEVICEKCKGRGKISTPINPNHLYGYNYSIDEECTKCCGDGKLDWIENVVGKRKINKFHMNTMYGSFIKKNHSLITVTSA